MRFIRLLIRLFILATFVAGAITLYIRFFYEPNPDSTPPVISHSVVLQEITRMGKLELVKYNFKDIVEYEKDMTEYETLNKYLNAKARAILIVSGEAVGCIDLTKISSSDVTENADTLIVYLPEPELCVYKINHDQSKLYDVENTYFIEEGKLVNEAYAAAEKQIEKSARNMGILDQTRENAHKILRPFLEKISGKPVRLQYRIKGGFKELDR
jgi:hypothetical protein